MGRRKRSGGPAFSLFAFQDIITCVMGIMLLLTLMLAVELSATEVTRSQSSAEDSLKTLETEASELMSAIESLEQQLATQAETMRSGALSNARLLEQNHTAAIRNAAESRQEAVRVAELAQTSEQNLNDVRDRYATLQTTLEEIQTLELQLADQQKELAQLKSGNRLVYNKHSSSAKFCWIIELDSPTQIRAALMGNESECTTLKNIAAAIDWISQKPAQDSSVMLLVKPGSSGCLEDLSRNLRQKGIPFGFDLLPQETTVLTISGSPE